MTAQIIPFSYDERPVRTLLINDQPWFVASDIAKELEYQTAKDMARNLDDDERGRQIVPTPSGDQMMTIINESGLYSAILRSRKPEAKRFKKWVTSEVLPAIRKHGHYHDTGNQMTTLLGQTIGTDGFHVLGALIKGKVANLPAAVRRRATAKLWAQTHAAFGVRTAADIPAEQMDSARNFVAAYAIEGEFLPAKQAANDAALGLDDGDLQSLHILLRHFDAINRCRTRLHEAAERLDSRLLLNVFSHIKEASPSARAFSNRHGERLAAMHSARLARHPIPAQ